MVNRSRRIHTVRPRFGHQKQHQTLGMLPWTLSWLCGSPPGCCIARSSDLSPNHRVSLFHDFPEGMYSVLRTTVPVKRVLFSQSRRPVSDRVRPPQEESTRKMVYNSWFSVENPTRRVAFCIMGSGYGASQTVMIEVRDKCLSAVANSVGGSSSPSSERVSYYLNQDKHIGSITNEVRRRGETQAIHSSGVLLRSATTFAYNGNSPTDDYTSFEFDIIDLLPESGYNQVRRPNVARLRCLFRLPADLNIDGPNPSSCFPDLQHSEQPRSVS